MRASKKVIARIVFPWKVSVLYRLRLITEGVLLKRAYHLRGLRGSRVKILPGSLVLAVVVPCGFKGLANFLKHYDRMKIDRYLFVLDEADDANRRLLEGRNDVSVWTVNELDQAQEERLKDHILAKHAISSWVVDCRPDEYLVYPCMEKRSLRELIGFLGDIEIMSMFTPVVELYPGRGLEEKEDNNCFFDAGQEPCFDRVGYYTDFGSDSELQVKGGPSLRVSAGGHHADAPYMGRVALYKKSKTVRHAVGKHGVLQQDQMNYVHEWNFPCPTGVLLRHFQASPSDAARLHVDDPLLNISQAYEGPRSLEEAGLMEAGIWH